jgi:hypothetical protein
VRVCETIAWEKLSLGSTAVVFWLAHLCTRAVVGEALTPPAIGRARPRSEREVSYTLLDACSTSICIPAHLRVRTAQHTDPLRSPTSLRRQRQAKAPAGAAATRRLLQVSLADLQSAGLVRSCGCAATVSLWASRHELRHGRPQVSHHHVF